MTHFDGVPQGVPNYMEPQQFAMPQGWQTVAEITFTVAALTTVLVAGWIHGGGKAGTRCCTRSPAAALW